MFHLFSLSQPLAIGGARSSPFLPLSLELGEESRVEGPVFEFTWFLVDRAASREAAAGRDRGETA